MKIAIGCDHGALALKNKLLTHLEAKGYEVKDFGTYTLDSCDYPDFAGAAAKAVAAGECEKGIVLCTTGIGVSIAANKVKGAYAACVHDIYQAQRAQLSNNANIITMGAQVIGTELAKCMVTEYLSLTYDPNSRSKEKVERIVDFENGK